MIHARIYCAPASGKIENYGFVYLETLQILPVKLMPSANFDHWLNAIVNDSMRPKIIRVAPQQFGCGDAIGSNPFTKTADFLRENAPKLYKKSIHNAIKQAHLNSFQLQPSMQQTVDTHETETLWRQFAALKTLPIRKSATIEADIKRFKAETGVVLPAELQTIYRLTDGAPQAFGNLDFLSLSEVIKAWKGWKDIFDDWTLEELTGGSYRSDREKTLAMYINPFWIPFIDNISGNYYALDLMPGKQGKQGQIIAFGADTDLILCLSDNINNLLRSHIEMLENPQANHPLRRHFFWDEN